MTARRMLVVLGASLGLLSVTTSGALASSSATRVVAVPVGFQVKNTNTSGLACPSDGAAYVVRGHLTGPRSALRAAAVTVYLYGLDTGGWNWRLTAVPGYDFAAQLARRGHVSLTIDMLGYGASGHPYGFESCIGSQADVTHQIIAQLRSGNYSIAEGSPVAYRRVVLAGHDVGGQIAQVEAYSYKDVDGLIVVTWAEQGFTPFLQVKYAQASARCATGGEPSRPGGPGGYVYVAGSVEDFERHLFHNAEPAVVAAAGSLREPNPCGYLSSAFPPGIATDLLRLREIDVPVLLALGANDPVFDADGWAMQERHFSGSRDVSSILLADTGHFPMLERTVPRLRTLISGWLTQRGLASPSAATPAARVRLLLGSTRGMSAARNARPFWVQVRAVGGRLHDTRIVLRDARGRRVASSRRFSVAERPQRVPVWVTRGLRPGRYRIVAVGRDAAGQRVRAVKRVRLGRGPRSSRRVSPRSAAKPTIQRPLT